MTPFALLLVLLAHQVTAQQVRSGVAKASNEFANQFYKAVASKTASGNVLVCPLSLHVALTLVHQGAGGNTANQLKNVLKLNGVSNANINQGYQQLLSQLKDNTLNVATHLYPAAGYSLRPEYIDIAKTYFKSGVTGVDYNNPVEAAKTINEFVESQTNHKIKNLISPDSISGMTRLIIINAVHFQATWKNTFSVVFDGKFRVTPTDIITTQLMAQTDYFDYVEDPVLGAKVLKMDYSTGGYSMVFVLPLDEKKLSEVEDKLANTNLETLFSSLHNVKVEVTIPKFTMEQTMNLKDILTQMGATDLFTANADLHGITANDHLFVDQVIQKTYIDVNENGTEAAAATGVLETLSSYNENEIFNARWPFTFYLIQDKDPKVVLFKGKLVRPIGQKVENKPAKASSGHKQGELTHITFPSGTTENRPSIGNLHQKRPPRPQESQQRIGEDSPVNPPPHEYGQSLNNQNNQNQRPSYGGYSSDLFLGSVVETHSQTPYGYVPQNSGPPPNQYTSRW